MGKNITLATIRDDIRYRADLPATSKRLTDAQLDRLIGLSLDKLMAIVSDAYGDDYFTFQVGISVRPRVNSAGVAERIRKIPFSPVGQSDNDIDPSVFWKVNGQAAPAFWKLRKIEKVEVGARVRALDQVSVPVTRETFRDVLQESIPLTLQQWLHTDAIADENGEVVSWSSRNDERFTNIPPAFVPNLANPVPTKTADGIVFDGTQALITTNSQLLIRNEFTIALSFKPTDLTLSGVPFYFEETGGGDNARILVSDSNGGFLTADGTFSSFWNATFSIRQREGVYHVAMLSGEDPSTAFMRTANGDETVDQSPNFIALPGNAAKDIILGAKALVTGGGAVEEITLPFTGVIREVLLFDRALTAEENDAVEYYLKSTGGIEYGYSVIPIDDWSGQRRNLPRLDIDRVDRRDTRSFPAYRMTGDDAIWLELEDTDEPQSFVIWYTGVPLDLSDAAAPSLMQPNWSEYVIQDALAMIEQRDRRDPAVAVNLRDQAEASIIERARERDEFGPMILRDRAQGGRSDQERVDDLTTFGDDW